MLFYFLASFLSFLPIFYLLLKASLLEIVSISEFSIAITNFLCWMISIVCLKYEIIDNEMPSKRIRLFWMSLLIQNTIFFIFHSFSLEKINEFNSFSLFFYEIIIVLLNIFSFLSRMNYKKGLLKTINSEIQEELLNEKDKLEAKTRANSILENGDIQEESISSTEIVNKFMNFYEKEEKLKKSKKILATSSFSSDEENTSPQMKSRSESCCLKNGNILQILKVDIPKILVSQDSSDDIVILYEIVVSEFKGRKISTIYRKYSEFINFHRKLKEEIKGAKIQDLPNKPNDLGLLSTPCEADQQLINFRKFALKSYLQNLFNDPKFWGSRNLRDFLALSAEL
jgi:hypothetical protein